ncbi:MAG TPA: VOC family protein [Kineosporiaceae bacterium]|nr:VOC family protein [Kineosporiaceae bacterium]
MKAVTPFLWFNDDLEPAVEFYMSIFPGAKVHSMNRMPDGRVFSADFELAGQSVKGLNGGPHFAHTEAFSFFVECDDQDEVDRYWTALTADGGQEGQCGWLKDRFGLSWQIVPTEFLTLVSQGSPEQVGRVMTVMQTMRKLDLPALRAAHAG